ncbi:outer membrane beta-barrel protein [Thiotrichales bacterium 19S3-7]|nr:outer membrane beta-barrel protein [Thiotrichales bacterium 19S3-7]MCF6800901.1 outer membrane beta-barrel protein [Thiotrichales bacterium 19S3-11]
MKFYQKLIAVSMLLAVAITSAFANNAFTGFYAGLGESATFNNFQYNHAPSSSGRDQAFKKTTTQTAVYLGYGYEFKNNYYLGFEGGFQYNFDRSLSNNEFNFPSSKWGNFYAGIAPQYSIYFDVTPGYAVTNNLLIYAIFGVSYTQYRTNYGFQPSTWSQQKFHHANKEFMSSPAYSISARVGLGIEYKITKNITTRLTYVYSYGSPMNASYWVNGSFLNYESQSIRPSSQAVMLGLAYQF